MTRWPWVTPIVGLLFAITPVAREIFVAAFISSDLWMQGFLQLIYLAGVGILILAALGEWGVRTWIIRRRRYS
jgi:hypothetical protein